MQKSWRKKGSRGGFTFIDLFAVIGGFRVALETHGGQCIFSSEWDKNSQLTYSRNHGDSVSVPVLKTIFQKVIEYYPDIHRKLIPEVELRIAEVKLF